MLTYKVTNNDYRSKAVLVVGGHALVGPGETKTVEADWSDERIEAYRACKLTIGLADHEADASEPDPDPKSDQERGAKIREIINALVPSEDFTDDGTPDVRKINALAPDGFEKVTAAERDLVWAEIQAEQA